MSSRRREVAEESRLTAEDPLVDDGSDRKAVETVGEGLPQLDVVSPFAWREEGRVGRKDQFDVPYRVLVLRCSAPFGSSHQQASSVISPSPS